MFHSLLPRAPGFARLDNVVYNALPLLCARKRITLCSY